MADTKKPSGEPDDRTAAREASAVREVRSFIANTAIEPHRLRCGACGGLCAPHRLGDFRSDTLVKCDDCGHEQAWNGPDLHAKFTELLEQLAQLEREPSS